VDNWHRVRTVEVILTYRYLNVQYHGHEELILPPRVYSDAASLATFAKLQDILRFKNVRRDNALNEQCDVREKRGNKLIRERVRDLGILTNNDRSCGPARARAGQLVYILSDNAASIL